MIRRPAPPPAPAPSSSGALWMISFTDLVSLMLAFFVLMFAMREPHREHWSQMAGGLKTAPSTASRPSDGPPPQPSASHNVAVVEENSARSLDYLSAVLRNQFSARPALAGMTVVRHEDRLTISAPLSLLYEGGGLTLSPRGREALYLLAPMLGRAGNRVEVVGRVDAAAPGGWEQALVRAVAVSRGLRDAGYQTDLVARGALADMVVDGAPGVELVIREQEAPR